MNTAAPAQADTYNIVGGFDKIAPRYDLINDAMTFGLHRKWRKTLCRRAQKATPQGGSILDVATGTGDVIRGLIAGRPDIKVTGVDPSENMLQVGIEKMEQLPEEQQKQIQMQIGDARKLNFPDNTFHTITISWGIRNVLPFEEGLREMRRVLRPGGTLLVLESGKPENAFIRVGHGIYSRLLPIIGGGLSGFKPAYEYYTKTAETFACGKVFVKAMEREGYKHAAYTGLMGGIVYLYTGQK